MSSQQQQQQQQRQRQQEEELEEDAISWQPTIVTTNATTTTGTTTSSSTTFVTMEKPPPKPAVLERVGVDMDDSNDYEDTSSTYPSQQHQQQRSVATTTVATTTGSTSIGFAPAATTESSISSSSVSSIPKIMTQLLAIPTNRSCADCKSALVDALQIYASVSPNVILPRDTDDDHHHHQYHYHHSNHHNHNNNNYHTNSSTKTTKNPFNDIPTTTTTTARTSKEMGVRSATTNELGFKNNDTSGGGNRTTTTTFQQNHHAFSPYFENASTPTTAIWNNVDGEEETMVDPAITATRICYHSHGVFVCAPCGAAHSLLHSTTTKVKRVMDPYSWLSSSSQQQQSPSVSRDTETTSTTTFETTNHTNITTMSNDIYTLMNAGGNVRANSILEAYYYQNSSLDDAGWNNNSNHRSTNNHRMGIPRPTSTSTMEDRLLFIRAKYEALAFVLPSSSSSVYSDTAWQNVLNFHPEWDGLWGANLRPPNVDVDNTTTTTTNHNGQSTNDTNGDIDSNHPSNGVIPKLTKLGKKTTTTTTPLSTPSNTTNAATTTTILPNRLIDYFCVVTASEFLHPNMKLLLQQQQQQQQRGGKNHSSSLQLEDIVIAPTVSDCIPTPDSYNHHHNNHTTTADESNMPCENNTFPEHIATFVYPDGCTPSVLQLPPLFFTLVLTNSSGERLYGGVLRLYDDSYDTMATMTNLFQQSNVPIQNYPTWMMQSSSSSPNDKNHHKKQYHRSSSTPLHQARNGATGQSKAMNSYRDHTTTTTTTTRKKPTPISTTTTTSDIMFLPKSLVVLSHYPFFDIFRKFLLQIYRIALTEAPLPIERFVTNFVCEVPLPPPGKVQVNFGFTVNDCWAIERPAENQLPLANFSYRPLFTCLSIPTVLVVMGCLLQETRVVLVSNHYALLGPVSEALLSLLFPLHWQGMYLPILPYHMLEILEAPVPYLVGLHSRYLKEVPVEKRPKGVVVVDLDRDEVHLGYNDESDAGPRQIPSLPDRHTMKLRAKLLEFAACAYVVPNAHRISYISTAYGVDVPSNCREPYAQTSEVPMNDLMRRRDILPQTDKAFGDNELLVPISGFLSEQGQLYQRQERQIDTADKKIPKFQLKIGRLLKSPSDSLSNTSRDYDQKMERDIENILDMNDPPGFSTNEIRQAFLRFFTSLFQTYRTYLVDGSIDQTMFRSDDFLAGLSLSEGSTQFVKDITCTQMFQVFLAERLESPNDPEVLFFDDTINAKFNRSKKVVLTGRKKETAFLDDTGSMVTETYTPPPPSNFGLPDDGRSYQYSTFPKLDSKLFGKIRKPIAWREQNRRDMLRGIRRRSSVAALINEHAVVEKASRSLLSYGLKRRSRNLESALKILSLPFNAIPKNRMANNSGYRRSQEPSTAERDRSSSIVSNVTLPSEFDSSAETELTSAEEIVLNARRKQAILIIIISKFQVECRLYLKRKSRDRMQKCSFISQEDGEKRNSSAATYIQYWFRSHLIRQEYLRTRKVTMFLQAQRRGIKIRMAYQWLVDCVTHLQALSRGFIARRIIERLAANRMTSYKEQIFALWDATSTPLSYRATFWPILKVYTFLRLRIAEQELLRLWKELKIPLRDVAIDVLELQIVGVHLGSVFGTSHKIHQNALQVDFLSISAATSMQQAGKRKVLVNGDSKYDRVAAERTQFYDRLSILSQDTIIQVFSRYSIPLSEKKKKVSLTDELWLKYDEADLSAALMAEMFPELFQSTDIYFGVPSKKALRRFPCVTAIPRPLPYTLHTHSLLSDSIRRNLADIADIALRRIPAQIIALDRRLEAKLIRSKRHDGKEWQSRILKTAIRHRSFANESEARVAIIRHVLRTQNQASSSVARRSLQQPLLTSNGLREPKEIGSTHAALTHSNDVINRNVDSFNGESSIRNNDVPDSLVIPTLNNREKANERTPQRVIRNQKNKPRFSIKMTWTRQ